MEERMQMVKERRMEDTTTE